MKSDGSVISDLQYSYDKTGNRTSVVEADGRRTTWSYDAASQLISEHRPAASWNDLSLDDWDTLSPEGWGALAVDSTLRTTYAYDPAGNRTLKNEGGVRTTYSYDAANQLKWSQDASGRTTYTFDADGNQERVLTPDGSRTTTVWDYENRATSIQLPSGIRNTMSYEPGGLRVKLEESTGTKKFVWDDQNYLAETDGTNDTQVVYTNEPRDYGNLISQRRGSTTGWYHFDALGSTRQLTDATQAITDQKLYDAWGSVIGSSGSTVFPFQYLGTLGYSTDVDQSVIYVRARIYDPDVARWWSVDPLRHDYDRSLYNYCKSHVLIHSDPTGERDGLYPVCCTWDRTCTTLFSSYREAENTFHACSISRAFKVDRKTGKHSFNPEQCCLQNPINAWVNYGPFGCCSPYELTSSKVGHCDSLKLGECEREWLTYGESSLKQPNGPQTKHDCFVACECLFGQGSEQTRICIDLVC